MNKTDTFKALEPTVKSMINLYNSTSKQNIVVKNYTPNGFSICLEKTSYCMTITNTTTAIKDVLYFFQNTPEIFQA